MIHSLKTYETNAVGVFMNADQLIEQNPVSQHEYISGYRACKKQKDGWLSALQFEYTDN